MIQPVGAATTTHAATTTANAAEGSGGPAGGGSQAAAGADQLGATALPGTGPTQDALISALTQLVAVLTALIDALRGSAQVEGGGPGAKGGGPVQQSPVQRTPIQGAGPVQQSAIAGGGASDAAAIALRPVDSSWTGPYMSADSMSRNGYSTAINSGSNAIAEIGGSVSLQFFGRYGSASIGYGSNEVSISGPGVPIGTRVAFPDAGSVTLSTGATFSWSSKLATVDSGMVSNDPQFAVARPGAQVLAFNGAAIDQVDGFGERVASPLTNAELAELVRALASRYPAVTR